MPTDRLTPLNDGDLLAIGLAFVLALAGYFLDYTFVRYALALGAAAFLFLPLQRRSSLSPPIFLILCSGIGTIAGCIWLTFAQKTVSTDVRSEVKFVSTEIPMSIDAEQQAIFARIAKAPENALYEVEMMPDQNCISCTHLADNFNEVFASNGWRLGKEFGYKGRLINDPGFTLIYDNKSRPAGVAVLEQALTAMNISFKQQNPRFIGVKNIIFFVVNPTH